MSCEVVVTLREPVEVLEGVGDEGLDSKGDDSVGSGEGEEEDGYEGGGSDGVINVVVFDAILPRPLYGIASGDC